PPCGIFPLPITGNSRPREHALDASANPACCFRFLFPDRPQDVQNQGGVDPGYWQVIDWSRCRVLAFKGRLPLPDVLLVFPASLMCRDIILGALSECDALSGIKLRDHALLASGFNWITA